MSEIDVKENKEVKMSTNKQENGEPEKKYVN